MAGNGSLVLDNGQRLAATQALAAAFTKATGAKVEIRSAATSNWRAERVGRQPLPSSWPRPALVAALALLSSPLLSDQAAGVGRHQVWHLLTGSQFTTPIWMSAIIVTASAGLSGPDGDRHGLACRGHHLARAPDAVDPARHTVPEQ